MSAIISCSGGIIKAKEVSADMYSSIDLMLDKLVVQLKKYKEKYENIKGIHLYHQFTMQTQNLNKLISLILFRVGNALFLNLWEQKMRQKF